MSPAEVLYERDLGKEISSILKGLEIGHLMNLSFTDFTFDEFLNHKILMSAVIKEGLPFSFFELLSDFSSFSEQYWAGLLGISTKTIQRYRISGQKFKPLQSEKMIEMAEIIKVGIDFFGDMTKFKLWLETPNYALGKMRPKELLGDSYGKDLVISELIRMDHGIFV